MSVVERELGTDKERGGHALAREADGYFSGLVPGLGAGQLYGLRLDGEPALSRSGLALSAARSPRPVRDRRSGAYRWQNTDFPGTRERGQIIYELHVGTFTREGTYAAAALELAELARLGITTLEIMPLAEFDGAFGWGYDGVDLFAPSHLYGTPTDLKAFVDAAHAQGLAVILDVVYNHFGPAGCYLEQFAPEYFTHRYENEWGKALNFDGPGERARARIFCRKCALLARGIPLRRLAPSTRRSRFSTLRRGTSSPRSRRRFVGGAGAGRRRAYICAENEPQDARLVRPVEQGGYGCDALWNDDFHHSAHVALTGRRERTCKTTSAHRKSSAPHSSGATSFRGSTTTGKTSSVGNPRSTWAPSTSSPTFKITTRWRTASRGGD